MDILEKIKSEEFAISVGFELPANAMYSILSRTQECSDFRDNYRDGILAEQTIREYVRNLMSSFRLGERFIFNIPLALIAIGLEKISTKFTKEYISDLSKLKLAELTLSIEIAKICLENRKSLIKNLYRGFSCTNIENITTFSTVQPRRENVGLHESHYAIEKVA